MEEFISFCSEKTPSMKVTVMNNSRKIVNTYDAKPGFQLERYVSSLFPEATLIVYFPKNKDDNKKKDFQVDVMINNVIVETHLGVYQ